MQSGMLLNCNSRRKTKVSEDLIRFKWNRWTNSRSRTAVKNTRTRPP